MSDAHRLLRRSTRAAHTRLEASVDLPTRLADPVERARVVQGFAALHAAIEDAAEPWLADVPSLGFSERRRTGLLARDLADLGVGHLPPAPLAAGDSAEAMGMLYVAEGSTLGGQVIRRSVTDMAGLGFLDPYGAETGVRWRGFLAVLEDLARTPDQRAAAIVGARRAFACAEALLATETLRV